MEEQYKLDRLPSVLPLVVGAVSLILLIAYMWVFRALPANENPSAWGAFGDYVGGILNPLVSAFTLYVAVKVWQLQKSELSATKRELETQRGQQRFFDLMNIYHQTVESVSSNHIRQISRMRPDALKHLFNQKVSEYVSPYEEMGSESITLRGKSSLSHKLELLEERAVSVSENSHDWLSLIQDKTLDEISSNNTRELLTKEWRIAQKELLLAHYFRIVTIILREAESLLGKSEHLRYVDMFVAQLTDDEITLLAYYTWLAEDGPNLCKYGSFYGLLRNSTKHRDLFEAILPASLFVDSRFSTGTPQC